MVAGSAIWGGSVFAQPPAEPVPPGPQTAPAPPPPGETAQPAPPEDPVEWGPIEEVGPPPTIRVPLPPPPPPPPERSEPKRRPPSAPVVRREERRRCPDGTRRLAGEDGGALAPPPHCPAPAKERPPRRPPAAEPPGPPTAPPAPTAPGFIDALPGPSSVSGVPNFIIRKFRVPPFLLPIYQAAGIEYGIRWEVLAAINEIETDYGRNLNVSSAGAVGWMQFMPSTWAAYGTDANKDGRKDPYNPVDAIFAAARYLKAANYDNDVRAAIWAYNHADWYVDSVLLRARLIAGVPADLIGSLTGLTEGRFPVYARARYADALGRSIRIFSTPDAPIVAVNDGVVRRIGRDEKLGRFVVLEDAYGNRFTYAGIDAVARFHPVLRRDGAPDGRSARALHANAKDDPAPRGPASAGRQTEPPDRRPAADRDFVRHAVPIEGAPLRAPRHAGRPGQRRARAAPRGRGRAARLRGLRLLLLPAGRARSGQRSHPPAPPGLAGHRGHGARQIGPARLLDPPGRPRRAEDRPEADPGRLEAARGHRHLPRLRHERPPWRGIDRPGPAASKDRPGEACAGRRAHRDLRLRPRRHPRGKDRPPRARRTRVPGRVGPGADGHQPRVWPRLLHELGQRLAPLVGQRGRHRRGERHPDPRPPGAGRDNRADRPPADGAAGDDGPAQIISLFEIGGATFAMDDHADHVHLGFRPQIDNIFRPVQWTNLLERLRQIENPVVPRPICKSTFCQ